MSTSHGNGLAEFGYSQSLDRSIGRFASFAAGISYISILTGTFHGTLPAHLAERLEEAP